MPKWMFDVFVNGEYSPRLIKKSFRSWPQYVCMCFKRILVWMLFFLATSSCLFCLIWYFRCFCCVVVVVVMSEFENVWNILNKTPTIISIGRNEFILTIQIAHMNYEIPVQWARDGLLPRMEREFGNSNKKNVNSIVLKIIPTATTQTTLQFKIMPFNNLRSI